MTVTCKSEEELVGSVMTTETTSYVEKVAPIFYSQKSKDIWAEIREFSLNVTSYSLIEVY
jgi:hypothetical protein